MKYCSNCKEYKNFSEFHNDRSAKDGKTYQCKSCAKQRASRWQKDNIEQVNKKNSRWQKENREKKNEYNRIYRNKNLEKIRSWRRANESLRKANKIKATPSWTDTELLALIYDECPSGYQVDHIVPLRGEFVCGLHTHNNLQYLTPEENFKKNNKLLLG